MLLQPSVQMQRAVQQRRLAHPSGLPLLPGRPHVRSRRASVAVLALLLDPSDAVAHVQTLVQHLPLAYEPVAAPCSLMNCGDVVHRSTLDPVLRGEVRGVDWKAVLLLAVAGLYMFSTPGVVPGAIDYYLAAPLQRRSSRPIAKADLKLGKLLGSGGFGSVYKATLTDPDTGGTRPVVVKKAKEYGEAEVWMNERMSRVSPGCCAEFLGAFLDTPTDKVGPAAAAAGLGSCVWLVWADEGDLTLWDAMRGRDFPFNLEPLLLERPLRLPADKRRRLVSYKLVLAQVLEALEAAHATGIVHRDVKPQNIILSAASRRAKLIDLGAAADLRLGINYVPNEYLLDPRYAPPQQYVMSRQTAKPPPKPVAALLSPVLWQMERPDKFDMYSVGVLLLQMVFPALRTDNALAAFNKKLAEVGWDLKAWRSDTLARYPRGLPKDLAEGWDVLDAEEGAGWDLAAALVAYSPGDRLTASQCLVHPFLASSPVSPATSPAGTTTVAATAAASAVRSLSSTVGSTVGSTVKRVTEALPAGMLEDAFIHSDQDGLTEAFLSQEFGYDLPAPGAPPQGRETVAWFMDRQGQLQRRLAARQEKLGQDLRRTVRGVRKQMGLPGDSSGRPNSPKARAAAAAIKANAAAAAAAAASNGNGSSARAAGGGGLLAGLFGGGRKQQQQAADAAAPSAAAAAAAAPQQQRQQQQQVVRVRLPPGIAAAAAGADADASDDASSSSAKPKAVGSKVKELMAVFGGRR